MPDTFVALCPFCEETVVLTIYKNGREKACPKCGQLLWSPSWADVQNSSFRRNKERMHDNALVAEVFPYIRYSAIRNGCIFSNHIALESQGIDGTSIYRKSDPFWDYFTPPWEPGCGCSVVPITVEKAAEEGVQEAIDWQKSGIAPKRPTHVFGTKGFRFKINPNRKRLGPYLSAFFEPYDPSFFEIDEE